MLRLPLARCSAVMLLATSVAMTEPTAFGQDDGLHPTVKLETTLGDIVLQLDAEKAPITVTNFVQYVEDKFFDGTIFHRVIPNFMMQGGGFLPSMDKKAGLRGGIKLEAGNGLSNKPGTVAMARTGDPNSRGEVPLWTGPTFRS